MFNTKRAPVEISLRAVESAIDTAIGNSRTGLTGMKYMVALGPKRAEVEERIKSLSAIKGGLHNRDYTAERLDDDLKPVRSKLSDLYEFVAGEVTMTYSASRYPDVQSQPYRNILSSIYELQDMFEKEVAAKFDGKRKKQDVVLAQ